MKQADKSLILFKYSTFGLEEAHATLNEQGLTVTQQNDTLIVQWCNGPQLRVNLFQGPKVEDQISKIASKSNYKSRLANFDAWFQITFDDLDEVLDEINTLIEVQATLQNAIQGFIYNTWNKNLTAPEN